MALIIINLYNRIELIVFTQFMHFCIEYLQRLIFYWNCWIKNDLVKPALRQENDQASLYNCVSNMYFKYTEFIDS